MLKSTYVKNNHDTNRHQSKFCLIFPKLIAIVIVGTTQIERRCSIGTCSGCCCVQVVCSCLDALRLEIRAVVEEEDHIDKSIHQKHKYRDPGCMRKVSYIFPPILLFLYTNIWLKSRVQLYTVAISISSLTRNRASNPRRDTNTKNRLTTP